MSKHSSRALRYALVNATHTIVKSNATFKAYRDAKITNGRTHDNPFEHYASKLVRVIWKKLSDEVEFKFDQAVYMPTSVDFENALLGNFIKVTLFYD